MKYRLVAVGGTFDNFHIGHEAILSKAFEIGEKVLIGLTTDDFVRKYKEDEIAPFEEREREVRRYADKFRKDYEIVPLKDPFGVAPYEEKLEALVASEETKFNCYKINELRKRNNLKPAEIIIVPWIRAEDTRIISSTRIRRGEINRYGRVLIDYVVTEELREQLRNPVGRLFEGDNESVTEKLISFLKNNCLNNRTICVGDVVSYDLIKHGFKPTNIIIDGKEKREEVPYKDELLGYYDNSFKFSNPRGRIVKEAWKLIKKAYKVGESAIFVEGEEDLLGFPAVLLAEDNAVVIYGQPDKGKVMIKCNGEKKEELRKKLSEFQIVRN